MRYHKKHLLVYDFYGRRRGIVEVNVRKHGFDFCEEEPIREICNGLYSMDYLKKKLMSVGLRDNLRPEVFWKRWIPVINAMERIFGKKSPC